MIEGLAKKIKLVILDVDGVLTDGRIVVDDSGRELKFFDVQDGLGVELLNKAGIKAAIITGRESRAVAERARALGIEEVFQNQPVKINAYGQIKQKLNLKDEEICFVGDDVLDLGVMRKVGLPVAVRNATGDVKQEALYITRKRGGRGAVREVAELVLKSQNKWAGILEKLYGI